MIIRRNEPTRLSYVTLIRSHLKPTQLRAVPLFLCARYHGDFNIYSYLINIFPILYNISFL